jgi:tetratricopeptide (TPR) repeat protein
MADSTFSMVKAACALLALVVLGACGSTPTLRQVAEDTWIEARTDNFVVLTNAGEDRARYLVQNLEDFRRLVIKATNLDIESNPLPFHVVALSTTGQFRALIDDQQVFGAFQHSHRGGLAVVNLTARAPDGTDSLEITQTAYGPLYRAKQNMRGVGMDGVFHEYVHYLLEVDAKRRYPLWFHEGYAEYLSTYDISNDGRYRLGDPPMHRVLALEKARWIPLGALFNAKGYETGHENGDFNAESWLVVHYLMSDPDRREKLYAFLDRLDQPTVDTVPVFESIFGQTIDEATRSMRQYRRIGRFNADKFDRPADPLPVPSVRVLPLDEAKEQVAFTLMHFSPVREQGIALLNEALALNPENTRAMALLAWVALLNQDIPRAESIIERAQGRSPELLAMQGNLMVQRAAQQFTSNDAAWTGTLDEADKIYRQALVLNPDEPDALIGLARTWLIRPGKPSDEAMALIARARLLLPMNHEIRLVEANLRLKRGDVVAAVNGYEHVVAWAREPSIVRRARERLDEIYALARENLNQPANALP